MIEKKSKFLGICILISSILITISIGFLVVENRYKVVNNTLFDTFKGEFIKTYETGKEVTNKEKLTSDISKVLILKTIFV